MRYGNKSRRHSSKRGRSRRQFSRTAGTHRKNVTHSRMRGGYRL